MRGRVRQRLRQPGTGAAPGIISDPTGIVCAIGLRKLVTSYRGFACNVIRASDSATADIGFTPSGEFDVAAATAFKGASSLKVVTWYDQSGNGRNVTQSTDANRPTLNLSNSSYANKATVDFSSGSATSMSSSVWGTSYSDPTALFASYNNSQTNGVVMDTSTATATRFELYNGDGALQNPYMWGGSAGLQAPLGSVVCVSCARSNGASDEWWVNNKTTARATSSAGVGTMDGMVLGRYFGGGSHMTGAIRNIVCHSGTLSTAQRQQIMQAMADDIGVTV